jgi:putative DNA primase/helicase
MTGIADPVLNLLSHFKNVERAADNQWSAQCPCHDDAKNSLSISRGDDGQALIHDHAGCDTPSIVKAVGLKMADLFLRTNGHATNGKKPKQKGRIAAVYHYTDETGNVLFDAIRFEPKDFRQGVPKSSGKGWNWRIDGARRVLYRLPRLSQSTAETPVWIAEGEKDVHGLEKFGLVATTNPMGAGKWLPEYSETLRGRKCLIFADNDEPGRKHAQHVASSLFGIAAKIRVIELPGLPEKGDVSDWVASGGTKEKLVEIVKATPDWTPTLDAAPANVATIKAKPAAPKENNDPDLIAGLFLFNSQRHVFYKGEFYKWAGICYRHLFDAEFRATVTEFVRKYIEEVNATAIEQGNRKEDGTISLMKVSRGLVANVIACLEARTLREATEEMPFWLDGRDRSNQSLVMLNGVLDIDRLLSGGSDPIIERTHEFFTLVSLPYSFDPNAQCPMWLAFLERNLEADATRIAIVQEFFGLCLTPDTSFHKFLLMFGEGANGKSVLCAALRAVLGTENVSAVALEAFGERFALNSTLGKLANICPEIGEIDRVAEGRLKSFTSGEEMQFERKHKDPFPFRPTARLVLATNTLPRFADKSSGLWRRMILLPMNVVIGEADRRYGMDDPSFWDTEAPGILNWAIEGLRRLRAERHFTTSALCEEARQQYREELNPIRTFLADHFHENNAAQIATKDVYQRYTEWCAGNGYKALGERMFGREIKRAFPKVERRKLGTRTDRVYYYVGLGDGAEPPPALDEDWP